jgi:hypothetical protein
MAPPRFTSGAVITRNNFDALDGGLPRPAPLGCPGGLFVFASDTPFRGPPAARGPAFLTSGACAAFSWPAQGSCRPSTCRRPALLLRGGLAGERGRGCRQDFPLGRKPMLIGLAVHIAMCGPDLVSALANAVFEAVVHVRGPDC